MRRSNQYLTLVFLLSAGCTSPLGSSSEQEYPEKKAQIRQTLAGIFDACEKKDFTRLDSYHFYDAKFTKFDSVSPARLDAITARDGEHKGLSAATDLHMQAQDLEIDIFGQTGIATFILNYSFKAGGDTIQRRAKATMVFVNIGGKWKIVHEHLSAVAPNP